MRWIECNKTDYIFCSYGLGVSFCIGTQAPSWDFLHGSTKNKPMERQSPSPDLRILARVHEALKSRPADRNVKENDWVSEGLWKAECEPRSQNQGMDTQSSEIQFLLQGIPRKANEFWKANGKAVSDPRQNPGLGAHSSEIRFCWKELKRKHMSFGRPMARQNPRPDLRIQARARKALKSNVVERGLKENKWVLEGQLGSGSMQALVMNMSSKYFLSLLWPEYGLLIYTYWTVLWDSWKPASKWFRFLLSTASSSAMRACSSAVGASSSAVGACSSEWERELSSGSVQLSSGCL